MIVCGLKWIWWNLLQYAYCIANHATIYHLNKAFMLTGHLTILLHQLVLASVRTKNLMVVLHRLDMIVRIFRTSMIAFIILNVTIIQYRSRKLVILIVSTAQHLKFNWSQIKQNNFARQAAFWMNNVSGLLLKITFVIFKEPVVKLMTKFLDMLVTDHLII